MISNLSVTSLPQSLSMKRALWLSPFNAAFSLANSIHSLEISTPTPLELGNSFKADNSKHPVPVPKSINFKLTALSGRLLRIASINISLSGRGSRDDEFILNVRFQKPRVPIILDTGSLLQRRSISFA